MNRNATAQGAAEESFAGLLEHLTRNSRTETPDPEFETKYTPRDANLASGSVAASAARTGTRTLAPMTEIKAPMDDAPLSYESALRRHARYRPSLDEVDLPTADLRKAVAPGKECPTTEPVSKRRREVLRDGKTRNAAPVREALPSAGATKNSALSRVKAQTKSSPRSKEQLKKSPQDLARHGANARSSSPQTSTSSSPAKPRSESAEARAGKTRSSSGRKARPEILHELLPSAFPHATILPIETKTVALERASKAGEDRSPAKVSLLGQPDRYDLRLDPLDQKRSTVSVRLTEVEFLRLKERAGESGISVSAYMRSCILDADQLRSQVKHALAEMRSLATRPDSNLYPALPSPERNDPAHRSDWFRGVMRYAAFLLSPIFPFRRSA
jgi:hypothetical protein